MVCFISRLSWGVLSRLLLWMGLCHQHSYYQKHSWYVPCGPSMIEQPNPGFETFFCRKVNKFLTWKSTETHHGWWVASGFQAGLSPYLSALDFWKIKFDELDFLSISNLNFGGYTGSKNPFQRRQKSSLSLKFSNSIFQKSNADR